MQVNGELHALATSPTGSLPGGEVALPPIEQEARRTPQPMWTFWRTEKFLVLADNLTPDHILLFSDI
jgi:hypothetical protein